MFTGIPYYGTTYGNRPYHREMGETLEDMAKAVKWQEAQEAKTRGDNYRPREMGETPEDMARTGSARDTYSTMPARGTSRRPREMGETPEDVARNNQPKDSRQREMTEQEKVLDLYA